MTVKELKKTLEAFSEDAIIIIPNDNPYEDAPYMRMTRVSKGVNELDGYVILDNCSTEDPMEEQNGSERN